MSRNTRKPPVAANPDTESHPARVPPVTSNNSGRVKHDDRGNAIWEWAAGAGAQAGESAAPRPGKLDHPTLSLIDDGRSASGLVMDNPHGTLQGYSPYDSGLLGKKKAPRKKDLRRLSEWLKLKKQAASRTSDDE